MDPWNNNPKKSPWDKKNQSAPDLDELLTNLQNKFRFKFHGFSVVTNSPF